MVEDGLHVVVERDRALGVDATPQRVNECRVVGGGLELVLRYLRHSRFMVANGGSELPAVLGTRKAGFDK